MRDTSATNQFLKITDLKFHENLARTNELMDSFKEESAP